MWWGDTGDGSELVGGVLVAGAPHPGLDDPCCWLVVRFVEAVACGECVEGALLADWAVGTGFDCVNGCGVYGLGVGEDWVAMAGWFSLLHVLLLYTTFAVLGNIDGKPHAARRAFHCGVDGGHHFGHVVRRIVGDYARVYDAVT